MLCPLTSQHKATITNKQRRLHVFLGGGKDVLLLCVYFRFIRVPIIYDSDTQSQCVGISGAECMEDDAMNGKEW